MSVYSIYFSPTKGTETILRLLANEFGIHKAIDLGNPKEQQDYPVLQSDDICLFGVPSYGGRVPDIALQKIKQFQGNQAKAVLVVSYGNRHYDDTLLELQDTLQEQGFVCVAAVAAIAEHSMMHQFAAHRPDAKDQKELQRFAKQILEKIRTPVVHEALHVPGNRPYKPYHGVPLQPKTGKSCTECGLCAEECPVGAIPKENPRLTDRNRCITCMHCVKICPKHARKLDRFLLMVASMKMRKNCSVRKENELFL